MNFIVNRKVLISMLFLAVSMLGYISYQELQVELIPNAELPMNYVQISSRQEVTPDYMEQKAILPVEGAIGSLEGIESIESTAGKRQGMVSITYQNNVDSKVAYLKLEEKINAIRGALPDGFTMRVVRVNTQQKINVLMNLQVRGGGDVDRVRDFVDQKIFSELENIDGVASVNVYGGQEKSVEVILNKQACEAHNITPSRVKRVLASNMQSRAFAGQVEEMGKRFFVYVSGEYDHVSEIEDLIVGRGNIRLKDIAEVFYGKKDETTLSRVNGKSAVTVMVINDAQANIIDLSHAIREHIVELNDSYRAFDIEIVVQDDMAEIMEKNIDQIIDLALTGGLLAIFVLWIFLRNISLVMVVALAMPISVFSAFNFFLGYDLSINSLTLVGIALAVGMLLDNSVVVLENIYRLRSLGNSARDSVIQGTREVFRSVFAATLTTVTVFFPFIFSSNFFIKLLGKHIGVSIISTLIISLAVSLLLIPMAVHAIMERRKKHQSDSFKKLSLDNRGVRIYLLILKTALRNPAATVVIVLLLFFVSILGSLAVSTNNTKEVETTEVKVYVTMPTGSTLDATDDVVKTIETRVEPIAEKEDVIVSVEEEEAVVTIKLKDDYKKIAKRSLADIKYDIEKSIGTISPADISTTMPTNSSSYGGGGGRGGGGRNAGNAGLQKMMGIGAEEDYMVLKGSDFDLMVEVAEDLQYYLDELDNIGRSRVSVKENQPEVHLDFDRRLMTDYNITLNEVSTELGAFSREVSSGVNFKSGLEEYEIMIRYDSDTLESSAQKTFKELKGLKVSDADDEVAHELESFTDAFYGSGLREIERVNQVKQVEITFSFDSEVYDSKTLLASARLEVDQLLEIYELPDGVAVEVIHEESELEDFYDLIIIAFILIFMILAAVFESFITPFVLLFSIPLAAIGSFLLLVFTGNSLFNANTLMGFLILIGVVVNNGIILIDFTNILRKRGYGMHRALMMAGLSRVRPILITAVTTCVAMVPLAMGNAEYVSLIGVPFAITVIGGLTVSTLLTLVFIPMLYASVEGSLKWIRSLNWKLNVLMGIVIVTGFYFVYTNVDTFLYQFADVLLLLIGVPSVIYFLMNSLRRAASTLVDKDARITINIRNLVKIYGRNNRFVREWKAGKLMSEKALVSSQIKKEAIHSLIWKIPLVGYLIYLTFWYTQSAFWVFFLGICTYLITLSLLKGFMKLFFVDKRGYKRLFNGIYFFSPLIFIGFDQFRWENWALTIVIFVLWYLMIATERASVYLQKHEGEWRNTWKYVRWFVRLVSSIPGLGKKKEAFKALRGISLDISTGMYGLLGPNGAGKSTMMRTICGIYEQSYGKIYINGHDTQLKREELQGLIGYLPQEFGMYENMTANNYLDYQAILKGLKDKTVRATRIKEVLESVHMYDDRNKKIGSFSGGMKQRIGIAQILLHLPRILVVDEPTAGLDPRERIRFRNLLVELSRERVVIFSTHIIEDISSSCNVMAVVNKGEVVFNGSPREMSKQAEGKVWKFVVPSLDFEAVTKGMVVVHHMREGSNIKVRCISATKPTDNAMNEHPLLEDAYLWLLKSENNGK